MSKWYSKIRISIERKWTRCYEHSIKLVASFVSRMCIGELEWPKYSIGVSLFGRGPNAAAYWCANFYSSTQLIEANFAGQPAKLVSRTARLARSCDRATLMTYLLKTKMLINHLHLISFLWTNPFLVGKMSAKNNIASTFIKLVMYFHKAGFLWWYKPINEHAVCQQLTGFASMSL